MLTDIEQIKNMLSVHMEVSQRRHDETQRSVRDISVSLMGDDKMGVVGIVKRTEANEEYIEEDKIFKSNVRGKAWGILLIGTPIITFLTSWLFWIITH